jgi:hypothetical protein
MGEQRSTISSSASQLSQMGSHRDALLFRKPAHIRSASCSACTASIERTMSQIRVYDFSRQNLRNGREALCCQQGASAAASAAADLTGRSTKESRPTDGRLQPQASFCCLRPARLQGDCPALILSLWGHNPHTRGRAAEQRAWSAGRSEKRRSVHSRRFMRSAHTCKQAIYVQVGTSLPYQEADLSFGRCGTGRRCCGTFIAQPQSAE